MTEVDNLKIYHDSFKHNQDPYIWNNNFLHSFCHITQISPKIGTHIFWVSGDSYPDFNQLICDCVFVVKDKVYWEQANSIESSDIIVDNEKAFNHHYQWVNPPYNEHNFKKKNRYTLKADEVKSFQPQDKYQNLLDIVPFLNCKGLTIENIRNSMTRNKNGNHSLNSRPFKLNNEISEELYKFLSKADILIKGQMIEHRHPNP